MSSIFLIFFILYIVIQLSKVFGNSGYQKQQKMSLDEAKILIALTAKVAKSDGVVNEAEAAMISEILDDLVRKIGGGNSERETLKRVYKVEKERLDNTYELAFKFNQAFAPSSSRKTALIYFFLNVAYIDRVFTQSEKDIISQISRGFGIPSHIESQIFAMFEASYYGTYGRSSSENYGGDRSYGGSGGYSSGRNSGGRYQDSGSYGGGYSGTLRTQSKKDPYEVLGVDKGASFGEIKKKYRELVKKYHPDILMGKGADDEIIQEGTKKLQEINEAYESLKEKFGEK